MGASIQAALELFCGCSFKIIWYYLQKRFGYLGTNP
jgi:hypothetical protein